MEGQEQAGNGLAGACGVKEGDSRTASPNRRFSEQEGRNGGEFMSVIKRATPANVVYYNCRACGAPLMDKVSMAAGWCGCKSKALREVARLVNDRYDPYGQPVVASEKSAKSSVS
jgi:hypothetical protein